MQLKTKAGLNKEMKICTECKSEYYAHTSKMKDLCPECAHVLYYYKNCDHQFSDGRCIKCFWDGSASAFIKEQKNK